MRYKDPNPHDTRIKKRFLILPKKINGETRWLEFATWEESYCHEKYYSRTIKWNVIRWIDNDN